MAVDVKVTPMFIGGKEVAGASGKTVDVFNPSTEELIGRVPVASAAEIDLAVRTAQEAFLQWRDTPASERATAMMKLVNAVRANVDDDRQGSNDRAGEALPAGQG